MNRYCVGAISSSLLTRVLLFLNFRIDRSLTRFLATSRHYSFLHVIEKEEVGVFLHEVCDVTRLALIQSQVAYLSQSRHPERIDLSSYHSFSNLSPSYNIRVIVFELDVLETRTYTTSLFDKASNASTRLIRLVRIIQHNFRYFCCSHIVSSDEGSGLPVLTTEADCEFIMLRMLSM